MGYVFHTIGVIQLEKEKEMEIIILVSFPGSRPPHLPSSKGELTYKMNKRREWQTRRKEEGEEGERRREKRGEGGEREEEGEERGRGREGRLGIYKIMLVKSSIILCFHAQTLQWLCCILLHLLSKSDQFSHLTNIWWCQVSSVHSKY